MPTRRGITLLHHPSPAVDGVRRVQKCLQKVWGIIREQILLTSLRIVKMFHVPVVSSPSSFKGPPLSFPSNISLV